jgi:hypothetical protein
VTIKRVKRGSGYSYYEGKATPANKISSVTQITGMLPSEKLIDWAANATADYAINHIRSLASMCANEHVAEAINLLRRSRYEVSDPAKKRGTEVHKLAEALIAGDEVTVPEELKGYVEAYTDFLNIIDPQPVATELIVVSRRPGAKFCGTADLVADLPAVAWEGEIIPAGRWLLDLKTGEKGVYETAALQLCGYQHATHFVAQDGQEPDERPMKWLEITRCGVVHLSSDAWELRPVATDGDTWTCFRYLLWLHKRQDSMKGWIGSPAAAVQAADLAAGA